MTYVTKVARLDGSGNAIVGVPPSRWAGTFDGADAGTVTCLDQTLTKSGPLLRDAEQLVTGHISFASGTPDAEIAFFLNLGG